MERSLYGLMAVSGSKGMFPKLIKFFRNSDLSHCYQHMGKIHGVEMIFEASTFGVLPAPFIVKKEKMIRMYRLPYTDEQIRSAISFAVIKYTGAGYGYGQLLGFIPVWIREKINIFNKKYNNTNFFKDGEICSELIWHIIKFLNDNFGGMGDITKYDENTTAPDHIESLLKQYGKLVAYKLIGEDELTWVADELREMHLAEKCL